MSKMLVTYRGDLRTEAAHLASQNTLITDAPVDNQGKGESFSPTDLMCTSLAACQMTIMGIYAQRENIDLRGMTCEVQKIMAAAPRRVAEIVLTYHLPDAEKLSDKHRAALKNAAATCPVALSLSPDVKQSTSFNF